MMDAPKGMKRLSILAGIDDVIEMYMRIAFSHKITSILELTTAGGVEFVPGIIPLIVAIK